MKVTSFVTVLTTLSKVVDLIVTTPTFPWFELACVVAGLLRWRTDKRAAYGWLRVAALVELLVSQIFNFTDSQFAAVGELPFNLLVLGVLSYHLRRPGT